MVCGRERKRVFLFFFFCLGSSRCSPCCKLRTRVKRADITYRGRANKKATEREDSPFFSSAQPRLFEHRFQHGLRRVRVAVAAPRQAGLLARRQRRRGLCDALCETLIAHGLLCFFFLIKMRSKKGGRRRERRERESVCKFGVKRRSSRGGRKKRGREERK